MRDINQITIIGRLTKDPEIKYTPSGNPVTNFSIANNNSFMQGDQKVDTVDYFDIEVWGNQAVSCEKYLKKGSQVCVVGRNKQQRWTDKTSGQTRSKVIINANQVQFLDSKSDSKPSGQAEGLTNDYQQDDPWQGA